MSTTKGRYRIQAVAEMTGIPAATLRAWERRYGVPAPARTTSSYRLYSDRDVNLVRQLRDLCARGIAPAEAAKVVLTEQAGGVSDGVSDTRELDPFVRYRERLLEAVAAFDIEALDNEIRSVMAINSASVIFDRVVEPTLREVGDRWHNGELSVGQEHMATEVLGNLARDLLRLLQPADVLRTALLACVADETHTIPLYVVGYRLSHWGFRSVVLGARTPPSAISQAVEKMAPGVVGLSMTIEQPNEKVAQMMAEYSAACGDTAWVVGGASAVTYREEIEGHGGIVAVGDLSVLYNELMKATTPKHVRVARGVDR